METKQKHYGIQLKEYLKKNGISVVHACKALNINRGTMYNRFKDGEFRASELAKVLTFINKTK